MLVLYFLVSLVILALDQITKWWVVQYMSLYESVPIIINFFYITSHRNRGAAFGILQNQQWLFIVISILVSGALVYYLIQMRKESPILKLSFALILGGALGNLLDRIQFGEVVDFFHFQFGTYHFPIFNIADSAIVVGAIFLLWTQLITTKSKIGESEDC